TAAVEGQAERATQSGSERALGATGIELEDVAAGPPVSSVEGVGSGRSAAQEQRQCRQHRNRSAHRSCPPSSVKLVLGQSTNPPELVRVARCGEGSEHGARRASRESQRKSEKRSGC